ncbi:hypothetical protein [Cupriavidus sp. H39]|uniref:hypothetical protein n=1 Tax=Cupriavidus sp. H39 TaxID=3401635 RepID=UPI003D08FB21
MARHFRRHVVPRTATWLARIFRYPHPAVAAVTAARHPQATLVMTECLWARSVEPNVDLRRWPYRPPPAGVFGDLSEQVMLHASIHTPNRSFSGTPDHTWLAYHAAAVTLLQLWALAEQRVRDTLEGAHLHCPDAGEIATGPRRHATSLVEPVIAASETWGPIARPGKAARCYRAMRHRQRRRRAIVAQWQGQGSALTYWAEAGWSVAAALAPANADLRRRRLLGGPERGTRFWIYQEAGGAFVARPVRRANSDSWRNAPSRYHGMTVPPAPLSPDMRLPDHAVMTVITYNIRCNRLQHYVVSVIRGSCVQCS